MKWIFAFNCFDISKCVTFPLWERASGIFIGYIMSIFLFALNSFEFASIYCNQHTLLDVQHILTQIWIPYNFLYKELHNDIITQFTCFILNILISYLQVMLLKWRSYYPSSYLALSKTDMTILKAQIYCVIYINKGIT